MKMLEKYPKLEVVINLNSFNDVEVCWNYFNVWARSFLKILQKKKKKKKIGQNK